MGKIIFTCKTITPLAMNGPLGKDPELRPPGIKASLRFWWRALHGHLSMDDLREKEGKLFGNKKGRSKILIRVDQSFNRGDTIKQTQLLPHKKDSSTDPAFIKGLPFKIIITYDESLIISDEIRNLFVISCTLGGWGKRSRRGYGSVEVIEIDGKPYTTPVNIKDIESSLNKIVPGKYKLVKTWLECTTLNNSTLEEYPKLWKVEIGSKVKDLKAIGLATHITKGENRNEYEKNVGNGRPRLASPIYISILSNGLPVISSLKKPGETNYTLQDSLKRKILS